MKALNIKDIATTASLDSRDMARVRGGYCGLPQLPSCGYTLPVQLPPSTYTSTVDISQMNNQVQSNATGNGSAVFCGSISAVNNQQGFNSVG